MFIEFIRTFLEEMDFYKGLLRGAETQPYSKCDDCETIMS